MILLHAAPVTIAINCYTNAFADIYMRVLNSLEYQAIFASLSHRSPANASDSIKEKKVQVIPFTLPFRFWRENSIPKTLYYLQSSVFFILTTRDIAIIITLFVRRALMCATDADISREIISGYGRRLPLSRGSSSRGCKSPLIEFSGRVSRRENAAARNT